MGHLIAGLLSTLKSSPQWDGVSSWDWMRWQWDDYLPNDCGVWPAWTRLGLRQMDTRGGGVAHVLEPCIQVAHTAVIVLLSCTDVSLEPHFHPGPCSPWSGQGGRVWDAIHHWQETLPGAHVLSSGSHSVQGHGRGGLYQWQPQCARTQEKVNGGSHSVEGQLPFTAGLEPWVLGTEKIFGCVKRWKHWWWGLLRKLNIQRNDQLYMFLQALMAIIIIIIIIIIMIDPLTVQLLWHHRHLDILSPSLSVLLAARREMLKVKPVHSLMFSFLLFLCLAFVHPPGTVACKMVFAKAKWSGSGTHTTWASLFDS